jgi:hypothetical protein
MATSSTSSSDAEIAGGTSTIGNALSEKTDDTEISKENNASADQKEHVYPVTVESVMFQVVLMFSSCYYGMLFSNWGDAVMSVAVVDGTNETYYSSPSFTFGVKLFIIILTALLLLVSMMLKICCPGRML